MRTLKPLALTALNAPFQSDGKVRLVLVVGAMVSLDGATLDQEQTLWSAVARLPGSKGVVDEMKPKTRGEAILSGYAFSPGGKPAPIVSVRFEVGPIAKEVWAIGDRSWKLTGPTEPLPFEAMPLSYDRAFGGEGFAQNPGGKGFSPIKNDAGQSIHPLPNLELAKKLVTSPRDKPPVAGFSPIDPALPQRMKKLGTYDRKWLETRYPEMAEDFDPTYFNVAPDDQWIDGFWQGGESFVLQNVHKDKSKIEGTVPRFRARALVTRKGAEEGALEDVALRCDTLWFMPHEERLLMLFRGGVDVADEEASDLVDVLVGLERADEPKPIEHYREVRGKRLDKDKGALHALREMDLLPEGIGIATSAVMAEMDQFLARENLLKANMRRRAEHELEATRENLRAHGVDPDRFVPKELPAEPAMPPLHELPDFIEAQQAKAEEAKREAERTRVETLARYKEQAKSIGLDLEKKMAEGKAGGPPKFSAEAHLAELRRLVAQTRALGMPAPKGADRIDDPAFLDTLRKAESALVGAYRRAAHYMPPASILGEPEAAAMRLQIESALIANHGLAERDMTGADLSGLDFSGRDLSGALLERANLAGCSFKGANVQGAVFARANLTGADLEGAKAKGANFGQADLTRAKLAGGDLTEAVLMGATLSETDLSGATLDRAKISDVKGERAKLAGIRAADLAVMKSELRGADLTGANVATSTFMDVDLSGANLAGARMFRTSLVDVRIEDASLRGIELERVSFAKVEKGSSLARSDLRSANLRRINFRGVDLQGADLREADVRDADFSKADLRGAKLEAARAAHARFIGTDMSDANVARADLLGARMQRTVVRGADFEDANLFRADADRMQGDDKTSFKGANLKQVRVTPATATKPRPPEPGGPAGGAPAPAAPAGGAPMPPAERG